MSLLIAATEVDAQALADKMHQWRIQNIDRYHADRWDVPRQNTKDGTWAIAVGDRLGAFKSTELGTVVTKDALGADVTTQTKVVAWTTDWNPVAKVVDGGVVQGKIP